MTQATEWSRSPRAAAGAAGSGAAGMSVGAITGIASTVAVSTAVAAAVESSSASATVTEDSTACSTSASTDASTLVSWPLRAMAIYAPRHEVNERRAGATSATQTAPPRQVRCHSSDGALACPLGQIPAHEAIRVTLSLPWGYQFAGQSLTLPTAIRSTHAGRTRTIATKRVKVHVARRTIVQVEFKRSLTKVPRGDYADSVQIHDIGSLPVSKDSVCVALPRGAKLVGAIGGNRNGGHACWIVKGLAPGGVLTETMTFAPATPGAKRPTPIFPLPGAKTSN